ncbi:MAG: type II toxin-antitoxin system HicA family toxin [Oscillospiraceae bacterium]|jgi:hypothetical protein|nr:type II toxin-antitoxin system HicA family toxin [Oscillospiraceae bacterium]
MSKKEKLIKRLLSRPKDFTFDELATLMGLLGFRLDTGGKTSGSRVIFRHDRHLPVEIHRPHPANVLKLYQVRQIIQELTEGDLL